MLDEEQMQQILQRIERIEQRLQQVEARLEARESHEQPTPTAQPLPPPPVLPPLSPQAQTRLSRGQEEARSIASLAHIPPRTTGETKESQTTTTWEMLVGGKGALWVGSLSTFLAVAFFLAYTWQYFTDLAKVGMGFASGLLLVALGEYSYRRTERWFSEGLVGAGVATFYLSVWAASQRYQLLSPQISLILIATVVATSVWQSLRHDALSLSLLASIGGFLTPVLLRTATDGAGSPHPLMVYLTALNTGILAVSLHRRWAALVWFNFAATILLMWGWTLNYYHEGYRWSLFGYVTANFLLFLGCACFRSVVQRATTEAHDILLLFADTAVYTLAGYALLKGALGAYPAAPAIALSAVFVALSALVRRRTPQNRILYESLLGIAVFFFVAAVPLQTKQDVLVVGWAVQAAALASVGYRTQSLVLVRAGQIVWALTLLSLAWVWATVEVTHQWHVLNERSLPVLATTLAAAWMAGVTRRTSSTQDDLRAWYSLVATLGGAWLVAHEIWLAVDWRYRSADTPAIQWYAIATAWGAYALLTYMVGMRWQEVWVQFGALLVAMIACLLPVWTVLMVPVAEWKPFWNPRWWTEVAVTLLVAGIAKLASGEKVRSQPPYRESFAYVVGVISLLVLVALSAEVYFGFSVWWQEEAAPLREFAAWFTLATLWSLIGFAMVSLGISWELLGLRVLGYLVSGFAVAVLVVQALSSLPNGQFTVPIWAPIGNVRAMAFAVNVVTLGGMAWLLDKSKRREEGYLLSSGAYLLAGALLLWGLTQETYMAFYYWHTTGGLAGDWQRPAQMAISLVWTLFGGALLLGGVLCSVQSLRLAALSLLCLTALKVFFFDLSFLNTPLRVLSFGGLGLTLIAISWMYSRLNRAAAR